MKKKTWLKYFVIITLILLVIFWVDHIYDGYQDFNISSTIFNPIFVIYIFYIIFGLLLGLEHFIKELQKVGKWRINLAKLVLFGIPSY